MDICTVLSSYYYHIFVNKHCCGILESSSIFLLLATVMQFVKRYIFGMILILIWLGWATFLSSIFEIHNIDGWFFGEIAEVFATDTQTNISTTEKSVSENEINFASFMQKIVQALYLLMWPLLAVAGAALDNSLVYGDWFFLRPSLWNMRQIMRNFAFFALGGIFLFGILYNLVKWWDAWEKRSFKKLLPKMLIASLLIQASRFMMSALIDLSTIWVYSVWSLPINILTQENEVWWVSSVSSARFPKPNVFFSLDNTKKTNSQESTHVIYYTCSNQQNIDNWKSIIIPCRTEWDRLIPLWDEANPVDNTRYHWKRKQAGEILNFRSNNKSSWRIWDNVYLQISDDYCYMWGSIIKNENDLQNENGDLVWRLINACTTQHLAWHTEINWKLSAENNMSKLGCSTLDEVINSAQGMTWPMYSLYASIFRMAEISLTPNHKWIVEISLEFILKVVIWFALIIPLFALSVMLVVRAVILRWFIVFFAFTGSCMGIWARYVRVLVRKGTMEIITVIGIYACACCVCYQHEYGRTHFT